MNMQSVSTTVKAFSRECFGIEVSMYCGDKWRQNDIGCKEEGSLDGIFQFFYHNIGDIEIEIRILIDTIEDTDQFVSIHLDTVR